MESNGEICTIICIKFVVSYAVQNHHKHLWQHINNYESRVNGVSVFNEKRYLCNKENKEYQYRLMWFE